MYASHVYIYIYIYIYTHIRPPTVLTTKTLHYVCVLNKYLAIFA